MFIYVLGKPSTQITVSMQYSMEQSDYNTFDLL